MSDELLDEVEALNSIYGEGTLVPAEPSPSDDAAAASAPYILHLPSSSSLRILFPATYPASSPPEVPSIHHASHSIRGAGARDLRLFRESVGRVWVPDGGVCLFDAVEEYTRLREEEQEQEEEAAAEAAEAQEREGERALAEQGERGEQGAAGEAEAMEEVLATMVPPRWTVSDVTVDMKSTFVAHVAPITSPAEASLFIAHLLTNKKIASATHNISAYRVRGAAAAASAAAAGAASSSGAKPSATVFQDCDDDGETAAGSRLLHLMQLMDIWDAVVVVTRWYGGVKLGPRRFAVINTVAREGFVKAGMVAEKEEGGGKKGRKGK